MEIDTKPDPLAEALADVLEFGGPAVTYPVPEDAKIRPGTGPNIWDGLTISYWNGGLE